MNKTEFLVELRAKLTGIPQNDIDERIIFYGEMIDDRMEEGLTEEEAVEELGSLESVVTQIMSEIPLTRLVKEKVKPSRTLRVWELVLLVLGSPIWLSLLIALSAIIISVYAVIWSLILSLWAIEFSLIGCAVGGIFASVVFVAKSSVASGLAMLGAGIVCLGLAIIGRYGCEQATAAILKLTRKILIWIKSCFVKKESST